MRSISRTGLPLASLNVGHDADVMYIFQLTEHLLYRNSLEESISKHQKFC